jgi:serine/threonine protein kinase
MSGTGNVAFSDTIITPRVASHLQKYDEMTQNEDMDQLTRYGKDDINRISKLGEGCFTNVFLVSSPQSKHQMALKCLDQKKIRSPSEFLGASRDLICEATFLSELEHPNIVAIHGVCMDTVAESYTGQGEGYFVLTDVMQATLKDRLALWRNDPSSYKKRGIAKRLMNKGANQEKLEPDAMKYRIDSVALGVADAMNHIHKRDIILRNLNPGNIGFNEATGKVCLFDFGNARHLKDCEHDLISGLPNYMAPEVMRAEGYSFASDVYSFAMVLYEVCSLRKLTAREFKPFSVHTGTPDSALVRPNGFDSRPSLDCIPCKDSQYLIEDCWCSDPALRPSFEQISRAISDVVLAKARPPSPEDRTISTHSDAE